MSTWTFAKTREWSGFSQRSCVIWFPPPNPCSVLLDHSICRSDVKVERRWCLANSPHNFCMIRFTERAVVFRRNRSCSQWDCIFNFSNPYLISYRILGEILTRLLISWSYDLHRFLSLLRLLTFFFFLMGSDLGLVISPLSSTKITAKLSCSRQPLSAATTQALNLNL